MNLFSFKVDVIFLISDGDISAYSWNYSRERALRHMKRIAEFHGLEGELKESPRLERWLEAELRKVVLEGEVFKLPNFNYVNKSVYEELLKIPRGSTMTYSQLAKSSRVKYHKVLTTLLRNPFQILHSMP
ncbi:hypothetical protein DRN93_06140 [archaeon]|nr:MAG: hypothetical protein DRN93_06140 [archaeon]